MNTVLAALRSTVEALEDAGIAYALTGSLAAAHHGYIRATEDVDLKVAVGEVEEIDAALEPLAETARRLDATTRVFPGEVHVELYVVADELDHIALDTADQGALPGEQDRAYRVVGLEALMVLKVREHVRHGHGLKHIADVQQLIARNHDRLDAARLEELLALDPAWEEAWDDLVEPIP